MPGGACILLSAAAIVFICLIRPDPVDPDELEACLPFVEWMEI